VLVKEYQEQVQRDQPKNEGGDQQNVRGEHSGNERLARELAAEQPVRDVGAEDGDGLDDAVNDAQTVAGEHVVGKRVAGESGRERQDHEREAHEPVEFTRLAERAGEEDARHVRHDRRSEDQSGPVVNLPHEQAAGHLERHMNGRLEGLGHLRALQLREGAVVSHDVHRRHKEGRQDHAGQQQYDERVQGDLAKHERPVVGEELACDEFGERADRRAFIQVVGASTGRAVEPAV